MSGNRPPPSQAIDRFFQAFLGDCLFFVRADRSLPGTCFRVRGHSSPPVAHATHERKLVHRIPHETSQRTGTRIAPRENRAGIIVQRYPEAGCPTRTLTGDSATTLFRRASTVPVLIILTASRHTLPRSASHPAMQGVQYQSPVPRPLTAGRWESTVEALPVDESGIWRRTAFPSAAVGRPGAFQLNLPCLPNGSSPAST